MHGFGSHTFSFINKDNVRTWVKFAKTLQGIKNLTDEAMELIGRDRESHVGRFTKPSSGATFRAGSSGD